MITKEQLDEHERLDAEATKGPWRAGRADMVSYFPGENRPGKAIYCGPSEDIPGDCARAFGERCIEDAQLIAAMRNHFAEYREAARLLNSARAFFSEYGATVHFALRHVDSTNSLDAQEALAALIQEIEK